MTVMDCVSHFLEVHEHLSEPKVDKFRLDTLLAVFNLETCKGFTVSAMLGFEPKSMVRLAFDPRLSNNPLALIRTGSVLLSEKSCKVIISGRVLRVCEPDMLVLEPKRFKFELKLGVKVKRWALSSNSHEYFCLSCFLGVFGIENTSRHTSRLFVCFGGSESRLAAFSFRERVGVFGDWITRTGCTFVLRVDGSLSSRVGKFRSFLGMGTSPSLNSPSMLVGGGEVGLPLVKQGF